MHDKLLSFFMLTKLIKAHIFPSLSKIHTELKAILNTQLPGFLKCPIYPGIFGIIEMKEKKYIEENVYS